MAGRTWSTCRVTATRRSQSRSQSPGVNSRATICVAVRLSYAVVLTKADEVKAADQSARVAATVEGLRKHVAAYPEVILTSSRTGDGVADLRAHIVKLLAERGGAT